MIIPHEIGKRESINVSTLRYHFTLKMQLHGILGTHTHTQHKHTQRETNTHI